MWVWLVLKLPRLRVMETLDGVGHVVDHVGVYFSLVVVPVENLFKVPLSVGIV